MKFRLIAILAAAALLFVGCKQQGGKEQNKDRTTAGTKQVQPAPVAGKAGQPVKPEAEAPKKTDDEATAVAKKAPARGAAELARVGDGAKAPTKALKERPKPVRRPPPTKAEPKVPADRMESPAKGGKKPKVHIVEISDFQCPFCSRVNPTIKKIMETYGDAVSIAFYHNALPFHKDAKPAAIASLAAAKQGKFWEFHDKAFQNQRALKPANFEAWGKELGLDMAKFKAALDALRAARKRVEDELVIARRDLRDVCTARQEGQFVLQGILD